MILAFLGALIVGVSLGLLGSGGSILTVPVLVFILHRPDKLAIAESLAIVAFIAFSGAIYYSVYRQVDWKSVLYFGLPGIVGAYLGASCTPFLSGSIQITLFALTMFVISLLMFFSPIPSPEERTQISQTAGMTAAQGFFIGCLTGLIGCGGGFLIVPALVLLNQLPMRLAIGTSLVIIALNSFTGFVKQWNVLSHMQMEISWSTIGLFSMVGIAGSFVGSSLSSRCSQKFLRQIFAIAICLAGIFLLLKI
jgi:uncharacterized membrane protein YfcA